MCKLCNQGILQNHFRSRRNFLKGAAAAGVAAAGLNLFASRPAAAQFANAGDAPQDTGKPNRRYVIRGGSVMSMDPKVGDFPEADVLVQGKTILAVGPNLAAGTADVIEAHGRIVMPGFIDTHHHQFATALRSFLADGVLINDGAGTPSGRTPYFEFILNKFDPVYRPQDVYINELFGALSQLDDGVTTVHDVSQIHHTPQHSDAAIQALFDSGRRSAFGYFEGAGSNPSNYAYPQDAFRINKKWFSSSDQLVSMIMGGEVYLGAQIYQQSWTIGRTLGLQIAAHILSPFGIRPILDQLAQGQGGVGPTGQPPGSLKGGPDNLFIHIEMNMRHGMPPILKLQSLGMQPSLSVDVECTMTADFFTQMRVCMNLQRALVNQMILDQGLPPNPIDWGLPPGAAGNAWPTPAPGIPAPLTTRDVLRYATMNGAKALRLDGKTGSLTPGKEADIIILDATRLNVAPLNQVPGAVVSLMDRTNVETVIVAGKVRKWKGQLLDVDLNRLRQQLEASRDYIFSAAGIPQNLFSSQ